MKSLNTSNQQHSRAILLSSLLLGVIYLSSSVNTFSQETPTMEENDFKWKIPGAKYLDPSSFFSLHGYVDGVFASSSEEWTSPGAIGISMPGQVLVPNSNNSSFSYDAAIFIGSEMSEKTRLMMEMHLVTDPSGSGAAGPGGLTFVLTEATGSWDIASDLLTFSGGIFWLPFGTVNQDWLGAQNLFSLIPQASEAMPAHWNERGIRLNGMKKIGDKSAINYALSLGNGYDNWSIMGQRGFDNNENKSATGRVSVFPGLGDKLNLGFSYSMGDMNSELNSSFDSLSVSRYPSNFNALGADLTLELEKFKLRSYLIASQQSLDISSNNVSANTTEIGRFGLMGEVQYKLNTSKLNIGFESIVPKIRYDYLASDVLTTAIGTTENYQNRTVSFGVNFHVNNQFYFALDYNICDEINHAELNNDRFIARMTARF